MRLDTVEQSQSKIAYFILFACVCGTTTASVPAMWYPPCYWENDGNADNKRCNNNTYLHLLQVKYDETVSRFNILMNCINHHYKKYKWQWHFLVHAGLNLGVSTIHQTPTWTTIWSFCLNTCTDSETCICIYIMYTVYVHNNKTRSIRTRSTDCKC